MIKPQALSDRIQSCGIGRRDDNIVLTGNNLHTIAESIAKHRPNPSSMRPRQNQTLSITKHHKQAITSSSFKSHQNFAETKEQCRNKEHQTTCATKSIKTSSQRKPMPEKQPNSQQSK
ncbi:hypothetical protein [Synechococcus sp. UW179A]|uniref:hypothetical protein n=1 Tax=Synechococcus sp. UW179A TaxID=2575510 RepID=UPI0014826B2D|nr:hypothetical protein [Synechococcus sp. UW179A]